MAQYHEQSVSSHSEQAPTKRRISRSKALGIAATATLALVGGVVGAAKNAAETVSGQAVAAAESGAGTNKESYYRSEERNSRIKDTAEDFATRILNDANKNPDRYTFDDASDRKTDNRGELTEKLQSNGKTFDIIVSAKKEAGKFTFDTRDSMVIVRSTGPAENMPDELFTEGASYKKFGDERDDGLPDWDVARAGSRYNPTTNERSGYNDQTSSHASIEDPSSTVQSMRDAEEQTAAGFDRLLREAGI